MRHGKLVIVWSIGILFTILSVVFQRNSGPTHPVEVLFPVDTVSFTLPRSLTRAASDSTLLVIDVQPASTHGDSVQTGLFVDSLQFFWKRYPTEDAFMPLSLSANDQGDLQAALPTQPIAGKIAYYVTYGDQTGTESVILRFKDPVPPGLLIVHIILMFVAMLMASNTGLLAFFTLLSSEKEAIRVVNRYAWYSFVTLTVGGLFVGALVQKHAFGVFWAGFPLGTDVTDIKTLIAVIAWIPALVSYAKRRSTHLASRPASPHRYLYIVIVAALIHIAIYAIPHSTHGSEYNYDAEQPATEQQVTPYGN